MLFFLLIKLFRYRFGVCVQNLSRSFPEFSYGQVSKYTTRFYRNFVRVTWEMVFPSITTLEVSVSTLTKIREASQRDSPTILLLGHFGNWEVLNKLPKYSDIPIRALYKPIKNKVLNHFLYKRRTYYGLELIQSSHALKTLMNDHHSKSIVLFLADQYPGNNNGFVVNFLNQKTRMFSGAEQLARRLNSFVGYVELTSSADHVWTMDIQTICENASITDQGYITSTYAAMLEKSIIKNPSWWLWSHRRWK